MSCLFSPDSVKPAGQQALSSLAITSTATARQEKNSPLPGGRWPITGAAVLAGMAGIFLGKRRNLFLTALCGFLLMGLALCVAACGGGGNGGTRRGSYVVTVTATDQNNVKETAQLTLVVQ
jgi:hypothetical protein